jgi:hypothetical protein
MINLFIVLLINQRFTDIFIVRVIRLFDIQAMHFEAFGSQLSYHAGLRSFRPRPICQYVFVELAPYVINMPFKVTAPRAVSRYVLVAYFAPNSPQLLFPCACKTRSVSQCMRFLDKVFILFSSCWATLICHYALSELGSINDYGLVG